MCEKFPMNGKKFTENVGTSRYDKCGFILSVLHNLCPLVLFLQKTMGSV